jgi:hypothetical protein
MGTFVTYIPSICPPDNLDRQSIHPIESDLDAVSPPDCLVEICEVPQENDAVQSDVESHSDFDYETYDDHF